MTEHSLVLFWVNPVLARQGGSNLIGVIEVAAGLMIASRFLAPRISGIGSLTLSFLFTKPGLDPQSSDAGFLLKDLTLLGAALWSAGEAFAAAPARRRSLNRSRAGQRLKSFCSLGLRRETRKTLP